MSSRTGLAVVCLLAQIILPRSQAATNTPALEFTSVPVFGSSLALSGHALNVNPANFRVAVYIYVGGWYTKPVTNAPLTTIQANGNWSCNIATGGNDVQATRIAAFLWPSTNKAILATGTNVLPAQLDQQSVASLIINRYATEINFSGYKWDVKTSGGNLVGPGTNYFSSATNNVWVDSQGRLHLRITKQVVNGTNQWHCAEVVAQRSFGYGTYRISLDSRVDNLDPNVVLGFFTWSDDPAYTHREMDFEFSRWANASDVNNAQYVVQPFGLAGNLQRFAVPAALNPSTYSFKWETNRITYLSMRGYFIGGPATNTFSSWAFTNPARIPQARDENARINLWLFNGKPPGNGQEVEIIVNRFAFVPLQIAAPRLISAPQLTNGQFQLQLQGQTQIGYYIQGSTNLSSTNWPNLGLVSSPDGQSTFVDTNGPRLPQRFYRALVPTQ